MESNPRLKIPDVIINLIKIIIYSFYSDLHIVIFELLTRIGYASEYKLAKEINVNIEKIKLITNSLYSESFIRYEDRLFKQMKVCTAKNKQAFNKRVYRIRYWYIDPNVIIWKVNEKMKNIFSKTEEKFLEDKNIIFKCPRKICAKRYSVLELTSLPFNYNTGGFSCNQFLNLKVICGSELQEMENSPDQNNFIKDKSIIRNDRYEHFKIIVDLLNKITQLLKIKRH
jgi:transcription initiation factor IIE alpha subunit